MIELNNYLWKNLESTKQKFIRLQIVYAFRQKYDADNDISIEQE